MKERFRKLLGLYLSAVILAVVFVTPLTTVNAAYSGETYDAYDEISYSDLLQNGSPLPSGGYTFNGGNIFTYNATSPSYSAVFRFRWTVGRNTGIQFSFDKMNTNEMSYPFGVWVKIPNDNGAGPNGAWHLNPTVGQNISNMSSCPRQGQVFDIEFARLKVTSGPNNGRHYVYLKVNGELIKESYFLVDSDGSYYSANTKCHISNEIVFDDWTRYDNKISETPYYDDYDEISYSDLKRNGVPIGSGISAIGGGNLFTYDATSPSYSAILKFALIAGDKTGVQFSFDRSDENNSMSYPFGVWVKLPNDNGAGPNGAWHLNPTNPDLLVNMDKEPDKNDVYDIELARLKVLLGPNAGKYYVYLKVNKQLIAETYISVNSDGSYSSGKKTCHISNEIIFADWNAYYNRISDSPEDEQYEYYDEIGYGDLKDSNGKSLSSGGTGLQGATVLKYNRNSGTGSEILKFRWTIGTLSKFQMSFEKTAADAMEYMFGVWLEVPDSSYPNGSMWVRPGMGPKVNLKRALVPGSSHNIEYARLLVKNGPNLGKYLVYIKIDNTLVAKSYTDISIVDTNLTYYSEPNNVKCDMKTAEILFTFWGSEGNIIGPYLPAANGHEGIKGDFDGDRSVNASDLTDLVNVLIGAGEKSDLTKLIADFNNDGKSDILDLVAVKHYLAPVNEYQRTGDITLGMQEHLLEDSTKTPEYIADVTATMGAGVSRVGVPLSTLFSPTATNDVTIKSEYMNRLKSQVAALNAKGITEILYVTDAFVLPRTYELAGSDKCHHMTIPNPETEKDVYRDWLMTNYNAFKTLATEVPEIRYFEPFNEVNLVGVRLEKFGIGWNATAEQQAAYRYGTNEKVGFMADLCWYASKAVKSVNPKNEITTPSVGIDDNAAVDRTYLGKLYNAIDSGNYPRYQTVADKRVDNYFSIVNIHYYPLYYDKTTSINTNINTLVNDFKSAYNTMKSHNDGATRIWVTETGLSSIHPNETNRNETTVASIISKMLGRMKTDLPFIENVFFYKISDVSRNVNPHVTATESGFGLFYAFDSTSHSPYTAKPIAKTVYSFFNGGTTNYSALTALANRYN